MIYKFTSQYLAHVSESERKIRCRIEVKDIHKKFVLESSV